MQLGVEICVKINKYITNTLKVQFCSALFFLCLPLETSPDSLHRRFVHFWSFKNRNFRANLVPAGPLLILAQCQRSTITCRREMQSKGATLRCENDQTVKKKDLIDILCHLIPAH